MRPRAREDGGQSTVELALVLPVLLVFVLGIVQVALVAQAQIAVVHAARETARTISVDPQADAAAAAGRAVALDPTRTTVTVTGSRSRGEVVHVTVTHRMATNVPLIGPLLGDVSLDATAAMLIEP